MERSQLIPTPPLAAERSEQVNYLLSLPPEVQLTILSKLNQSQLINICLTNSDILNTCWDYYLATLKQWTKEEFIIFKLKLLSHCQYSKECKVFKEHLNEDLINNQSFISEYNKVINNSKIKYYENLNKSDIV